MRWTRHKQLIPAIRALHEVASVRFVLEVLVEHANSRGQCWPQVEEIAALAPRAAQPRAAHSFVWRSRVVHVPEREGTAYTVVAVRKALRRLDALDLVDWERVLPGESYPSRDGTPGKGREAGNAGGRVFTVNLGALAAMVGAAAPPGFAWVPSPRKRASAQGAHQDRPILQDRGDAILQDRPSDPLRIFDPLKMIPRLPTGGDAPPRAAPSQVASGTPRAMVAPLASRNGPSSRTTESESRSCEGKREQGSDREPAGALARITAIGAALARGDIATALHLRDKLPEVQREKLQAVAMPRPEGASVAGNVEPHIDSGSESDVPGPS